MKAILLIQAWRLTMTENIVHHDIYLSPTGTKKYVKTTWLGDSFEIHATKPEDLIDWPIVKTYLDDLHRKHGSPEVCLTNSGLMQLTWRTQEKIQEDCNV
jgi:hypothetical protein